MSQIGYAQIGVPGRCRSIPAYTVNDIPPSKLIAVPVM
jgi:hypothetical protein